jgi:hypothetical protein
MTAKPSATALLPERFLSGGSWRGGTARGCARRRVGSRQCPALACLQEATALQREQQREGWPDKHHDGGNRLTSATGVASGAPALLSVTAVPGSSTGYWAMPQSPDHSGHAKRGDNPGTA